MPLGKRRSTMTYNARFKRARMQMRTRAGYRRLLSRGTPVKFGGNLLTVTKRVNQLYKMIETKEGSQKSGVDISLPHNNITVVQNSAGGALNVFRLTTGADDPMSANTGSRIGDKVSVKGVMIKGFFENALRRSKVHFRVMLLRGSKGETFSRSTIFKGDANNKMIDQVDTQRFTIIAQKVFNISAVNAMAGSVDSSGQPYSSQSVASTDVVGIGTKMFKMWIPGYKFGNNGNIQYEDGAAQVKFYDYRICILAYDWYGTPQDVNNVGKINELYTKLYFKDA